MTDITLQSVDINSYSEVQEEAVECGNKKFRFSQNRMTTFALVGAAEKEFSFHEFPRESDGSGQYPYKLECDDFDGDGEWEYRVNIQENFLRLIEGQSVPDGATPVAHYISGEIIGYTREVTKTFESENIDDVTHEAHEELERDRQGAPEEIVKLVRQTYSKKVIDRLLDLLSFYVEDEFVKWATVSQEHLTRYLMEADPYYEHQNVSFLVNRLKTLEVLRLPHWTFAPLFQIVTNPHFNYHLRMTAAFSLSGARTRSEVKQVIRYIELAAKKYSRDAEMYAKGPCYGLVYSGTSPKLVEKFINEFDLIAGSPELENMQKIISDRKALKD